MGLLSLPEQPSRAVAALEEWLADAEPDDLVITTSGSSGRPKRVVLPRSAVLASAAAALERLALPAGTRWSLRLPAHYVAGVQVIVRALLAGAPPLLPEQEQGHDGPLAVSLVATQLRRLRDAEPAVLQGFHTVLLGGGPVDAGTRADVEALGVRVVATYGASETAGGCVYDGRPLEGVGVRLGEGGRLELSGPTLFSRYDGDPDLTAATLVDGWFRTDDLGRLDVDPETGSVRVSVLGRADDMVISGGLKIPAPVVERRLREHPAVREAVVLGVSDAEWGQRLVAFVTGDLSLAAARDWVGARHPREWAPRQLVALDDLPLLGNGKPDRRALAEIAR